MNGSRGIQHIFVLMLENRSFDHLLGFSKITGNDAVTRKPTTADGLTGSESNTYGNTTYKVAAAADSRMPADPPHDFLNVVQQLCGDSRKYIPGMPYPPVDNSGFVAAYAGVDSKSGANPGEIMRCFGPDQLPIVNALAREFVLCDNWRCSMPGPTWPNRMFLHAASSSGLDHTPSNLELVEWEATGYGFKNGTIFDRLNAKGITRRLYAGDHFPMVAALKGISVFDIRMYDDHFAKDLQSATYPFTYVFIEPSYDVLNKYRASTSQHPLANIHRGEHLIKSTYESIRKSRYWESSLLIITWDEHGGFYDHTKPSVKAVPPGDTVPGSKYNIHKYTFQDYGPRVPAIVVSPLIDKNLIDHRLYDHSSVPKTLEEMFGLAAMTERDKAAASLASLITLSKPRTDTPLTLPKVAGPSLLGIVEEKAGELGEAMAARFEDTVNDGTLPGVIHSALRQDLEISAPEAREPILARARSIHTRGEAMKYLGEVRQKIDVARAADDKKKGQSA